MHRLFAFALVPLLLVMARVAPAQIALEEETCSQALVHSRRDTIDCQTAFRLDPRHREDLQRATYGLLSDLRCHAHIIASRSDLLSQVRPSGPLQLPPQSVKCRLQSLAQPFDVTFRVAPVVHLDQGKAVGAELGVREVRGLPEPAATAVAGILNNDRALRKTLVQATNDLLATLPHR